MAAGYAGGKIAGELFDGRGYSELAGSLGASLGYATALGGTAIGAQAGATFGAFAGPVGAIAGAVLGGALGSVMGGGTEDYRFRTYSGELGSSHSSINTERASQAASDRALIKARDPSMETWRTDYKAKPVKAYNDFQIGNTFDWAQKINAKTIDKNYASFDGPFGSYTVGHIDDLSDKGKFAKQWVSSIEQLDKAVSGLLTAEEIAMAKEGLNGSVQASREWHNKAGAALATNNMIADRYAQIFQLAGRDDLYQQLVDGMERTTEANKENGGRANAAEVLAQILGGQQQTGGAGQFRVTRESPTAPTFRSRGLLGGGITRPQGEILPAMRAQYV
ncbi:MAG TPA: hypothetical protein DCZ12_17215 [Gammaproteobacteria bacterium]|nr:hypothetical protein [Gammaproteobacteria bacterium]